MMSTSSLVLAVLFPRGAEAANGYAEGQVWEYDAREEDTGSLLEIMRIGDVPGVGRVIHICVVGLKLPYAPAADGIAVEVPHLPMKPSALDASVRRLSTERPACMRFDHAYAIWKQDFERGGAGAISIPVKEMMERIAQKAKQAETTDETP